MSETEGGTFIG